MLAERLPASSIALGAPRLIVIVDTEEAFDWTKSHSRSATNVAHIAEQSLAQRIYERYHLRPIYVVDYPVATQEIGYRPLLGWLQDKRCEVGAHLHPWVNPPFDEEMCVRNTYPGNLSRELEQEKLSRLSDAIEKNLHIRPRIYKAGRYGIGSATGSILDELGYQIDLSVVPETDFGADGGPNFRGINGDPFWFGPSARLLEIPVSVGWYGLLRQYGATLQPLLTAEGSTKLHLPGILARLGLFERIRLTPEGTGFAELKRLTDTMLAAGKRVFCFTYHSPSLAPGNTPYVRNETDLGHFLALIDQYCDYFLAACGGVACTPGELRNLLQHDATNEDSANSISYVPTMIMREKLQ